MPTFLYLTAHLNIKRVRLLRSNFIAYKLKAYLVVANRNNIWVSEKTLVSGCFLFILFSFPHVACSCFFKQKSFLGTDFHFWS